MPPRITLQCAGWFLDFWKWGKLWTNRGRWGDSSIKFKRNARRKVFKAKNHGEKFSKEKEYDPKNLIFSFGKAMEQHYLELQEEEERRDSSWYFEYFGYCSWYLKEFGYSRWYLEDFSSSLRFHDWNIFHRFCVFQMEFFCPDENYCLLCPSKSI